MLPAITLFSFSLETGLLSPVINASSRCALPVIISPSTAIFSPGFAITMSPFDISSSVTSFSTPFSFIVALFGVISTSFCIASFVLSLLRLSRYLPSFIK